VKSETTTKFWERYHRLPPAFREAARKAYRLFEGNPNHPSLRFKPLEKYPDWWSVRVTQDYRAVGRRKGGTICWAWIGSHADFDKEFR
jgi:hypothetical protein